MTKIPRTTVEPEALALYAKGYGFNQIAKVLSAKYGRQGFSSRTYRTWYEEHPASWDAARAEQDLADGGSLSVDADIARLRRLRQRQNLLIAKVGSLSANEVGELKTLITVEDQLTRRLDADSMLLWLQRFMGWIADETDEADYKRLADVCRRFAERTFGVIDAAAVLADGSDRSDRSDESDGAGQ